MATQGVNCFLFVLVTSAFVLGEFAEVNVKNQLTCGPLGRETVLFKEHKESICCGFDQYNPETQGCCGDPLQMKDGSDSSTAVYDVKKQLCCGPLGKEKILLKKHNESVCCLADQYNPETQGCCGDPPQIKVRSDSCDTDSDLVRKPTATALELTPPVVIEHMFKCKPCLRVSVFRPASRELLFSLQVQRPSLICARWGPRGQCMCCPMRDLAPNAPGSGPLQPGTGGVSGPRCSGRPYDPSQEVCCDGYRYPSHVRCCAGPRSILRFLGLVPGPWALCDSHKALSELLSGHKYG